MKSIEMQPAALTGLALRLGLGWTFFSWGYDAYFNPGYYSHSFGQYTTGFMVAFLALGALLTTGVGTRFVAPAAATLFVTLGIKFVGHQPIGLPQDVGLAAAAVALALLGPGSLALQADRRPAPARVATATMVLRIGLASTFLVYGVQKFTSDAEYRVVMAEVPMLAPLLSIVRAESAAAFLGVLEVFVGIAMLVPPMIALGAGAQAAMLVGLIAAVGYPFSYPQDMGLLGGEVALVLLVAGARMRALVDRSQRETSAEPSHVVIPRRRASDWGAGERLAPAAVRRRAS